MAKILIISEDRWYPPNAGDAIRQFHTKMAEYIKAVDPSCKA